MMLSERSYSERLRELAQRLTVERNLARSMNYPALADILDEAAQHALFVANLADQAGEGQGRLV